jgi:hypothetical protein
MAVENSFLFAVYKKNNLSSFLKVFPLITRGYIMSTIHHVPFRFTPGPTWPNHTWQVKGHHRQAVGPRPGGHD